MLRKNEKEANIIVAKININFKFFVDHNQHNTDQEADNTYRYGSN